MYGDFSRDPLAHRDGTVFPLQQQGRVQLDSDWNSLASALADATRVAVRDVIGGSAALRLDATHDGFKPTTGNVAADTFVVAPGVYFVDGYRVHSDADLTIDGQPGKPVAVEDSWWLDKPKNVLVYLDVWLRSVTAIAHPELREVALRGPDTTTQGVLTWQVRAIATAELKALTANPTANQMRDRWEDVAAQLRGGDLGTLTASASLPDGGMDPCLDDGPGGYTGPGNQLYRVEIDLPDKDGGSRWKWSRDNGSVAWPVRSTTASGAIVDLQPGPRPRIGDLVELVDDVSEMTRVPRALRRITAFDPDENTVSVDGDPWPELDDDAIVARHAFLRRWDGSAPLTLDVEILLENGLSVSFAKGAFGPGDYWLIPTRVAGSGIIWPGGPQTRFGVRHAFAPIALVASGVSSDCRWVIEPTRKSA